MYVLPNLLPVLVLEQDLVPGANTSSTASGRARADSKDSTSSTSITAIEQELILELELDLLPALVLEIAQIPSGTSNLYSKSLESQSDLHCSTVFVFPYSLRMNTVMFLDIIVFESPDLIASL